MEDFKQGQQIKLADDRVYLYINTIAMDGHRYHFLSPMDSDDFIVAELINENGKKLLKIVQDISTIEKIQDYYRDNPNSLS